MVSLLNGFSQMGKSIATFAGSAAIEQQKADLEKEQTILANTLREGSETRLIGVRGAEDRVTGAANAEAQGGQQRQTDEFKNTLPMTEAEKSDAKIKQQEADTHRMDAEKPISGGFNSSWIVRNPKTGAWEPTTATASTPMVPDPNSNHLPTQIALSQGAINILTGQTKGQRTTAAQTQRYNDEIQKWGAARGIDTNTLAPKVEANFKVLQKNIERNNVANILEQEIESSIDTSSDVLDKIGQGQIKGFNIADVWAKKQFNDPDAIAAADQLLRLRHELAGYNSTASGQLVDGTPRITEDDLHAAEGIISNGINSGGLDGLKKSVASSAAKNRNILEKSMDRASSDYYQLFGATYHPPQHAAAAAVTGKADNATPDVNIKTLPPGVPSGSRPNKDGTKWKSPDNKIYDNTGKLIEEEPKTGTD